MMYTLRYYINGRIKEEKEGEEKNKVKRPSTYIMHVRIIYEQTVEYAYYMRYDSCACAQREVSGVQTPPPPKILYGIGYFERKNFNKINKYVLKKEDSNSISSYFYNLSTPPPP